MHYDYNEPCCGKDQCDRESAAAKTILRSYVDSGNDLLTAEDLHKSLHYGYGMKNSQVAVAEINPKDVVLEGPKIPNINNYHSFEFHENHMKMWRYYQIGSGKIQEYSKVLTVKPAAKILLPYSNTDGSIQRKSGKQKKGREDRQLCTHFFCPEVGCTESFERNEHLEEHMLSGSHSIAKESSSMDTVRKSFVARMKATTEVQNPAAFVNENIVRVSAGSSITATFRQRLGTPCQKQFPVFNKTEVVITQILYYW